MKEQLDVIVNLINEKVQFKGKTRNNPEVIFDYYPPIGDGQGYTGLEMFLMSLSACSATAVVSLLRKMNKHVPAFEVHAKGIRQEQLPLSFEKINLEFIVSSNDAEDKDILKAIRMSEESYCPVWAMLKNNVEINTSYRISGH